MWIFYDTDYKTCWLDIQSVLYSSYLFLYVLLVYQQTNMHVTMLIKNVMVVLNNNMENKLLTNL